jgi:hypothetical protein
MSFNQIRPRNCFGLALTSGVIGALRTATSNSDLVGLMEAVAREMGFRHYALIHHDDLRVPRPDRIDIRDYPAIVAERLISQNRYRRDPVIRGCIFADSAFLWSDLARIICLDRKDIRSLEFGAREGLNEGITVPCVRLGDRMLQPKLCPRLRGAGGARTLKQADCPSTFSDTSHGRWISDRSPSAIRSARPH